MTLKIHETLVFQAVQNHHYLYTFGVANNTIYFVILSHDSHMTGTW